MLCVMCHVTHVMCHMSHVMSFFNSFFFVFLCLFLSRHIVKLVGGGSIINGAYLVYSILCFPLHSFTVCKTVQVQIPILLQLYIYLLLLNRMLISML